MVLVVAGLVLSGCTTTGKPAAVAAPATVGASGAIGAPGGASASGQPSATAQTGAACIVGSWITTNWTNTFLPTEHGGAGARWTLSPDGSWKEVFDGSQPLIDGSVTITYTGTATGTVQIPSDPTATSGAWKAGNPGGTITSHYNDGTVKNSAYASETWTFTGTWTCSGNTMTVTNPYFQGTKITVYLTRTGS